MKSEQGMTFYQLVDAMEKVMTEQQELLKRAEDRLKDMTEEYSQCLTRIADLEAENRELRSRLQRYRRKS